MFYIMDEIFNCGPIVQTASSREKENFYLIHFVTISFWHLFWNTCMKYLTVVSLLLPNYSAIETTMDAANISYSEVTESQLPLSPNPELLRTELTSSGKWVNASGWGGTNWYK